MTPEKLIEDVARLLCPSAWDDQEESKLILEMRERSISPGPGEVTMTTEAEIEAALKHIRLENFTGEDGYNSPADAMRAALDAAAKMRGDGWQPIETAPKDGTLLLAAASDGRNIKGPTPDHLSFPATHWLPLPPAPSVKE